MAGIHRGLDFKYTLYDFIDTDQHPGNGKYSTGMGQKQNTKQQGEKSECKIELEADVVADVKEVADYFADTENNHQNTEQGADNVHGSIGPDQQHRAENAKQQGADQCEPFGTFESMRGFINNMIRISHGKSPRFLHICGCG